MGGTVYERAKMESVLGAQMEAFLPGVGNLYRCADCLTPMVQNPAPIGDPLCAPCRGARRPDVRALIARECDDLRDMLLAKNAAYGNSVLYRVALKLETPAASPSEIR